MSTYSRTVYAGVVVVVIVAAVAGFLAGQYIGSNQVARTITSWATATQFATYTQVVTVQQAATPPQAVTQTQAPSQEQLLAPIVEAARKEGKLVIYSTLDRPSAEPLLNAFKAKYPFIDLQYVELNSVQLYQRYVSERAAGAPTADIIWSHAADLQYLLIMNGSAQPYRLTIYDRMPEEVKYRDQAYVVFYAMLAPVYNKDKIPKDLEPKSFSDILKLLREHRDLFPPRSVTILNIEASAIGLIYTYYLYRANPELTQEIFKALSTIQPLLQTSSASQIELVRTGQAVIALILTSNYAFRDARADPKIGIFVPSDIAVLQPSTIFITKEARNPNAAKLFIEFVFSEEGQRALAQTANVVVMIDNPYYPQLSLKYLQANVGKLMVVRFGDGILDEILKKDVRDSFIKMWKSWLGIG